MEYKYTNKRENIEIKSKEDINIIDTVGLNDNHRTASDLLLEYDDSFGFSLNNLEFCNNSVFMFNIKKKSWVKYTNLETSSSSPSQRYGHTMNHFNKSYAILFGGYSKNKEVLNDTWFYNIRKNEWIFLDYLKLSPLPRMFHTAEVSSYGSTNSMLIIYGGVNLKTTDLKCLDNKIDNKKSKDSKEGKDNKESTDKLLRTTLQFYNDCWGLRIHRNKDLEWIEAKNSGHTFPNYKILHSCSYCEHFMFIFGGLGLKNFDKIREYKEDQGFSKYAEIDEDLFLNKFYYKDKKKKAIYIDNNSLKDYLSVNFPITQNNNTKVEAISNSLKIMKNNKKIRLNITLRTSSVEIIFDLNDYNQNYFQDQDNKLSQYNVIKKIVQNYSIIALINNKNLTNSIFSTTKTDILDLKEFLWFKGKEVPLFGHSSLIFKRSDIYFYGGRSFSSMEYEEDENNIKQINKQEQDIVTKQSSSFNLNNNLSENEKNEKTKTFHLKNNSFRLEDNSSKTNIKSPVFIKNIYKDKINNMNYKNNFIAKTINTIKETDNENNVNESHSNIVYLAKNYFTQKTTNTQFTIKTTSEYVASPSENIIQHSSEFENIVKENILFNIPNVINRIGLSKYISYIMDQKQKFYRNPMFRHLKYLQFQNQGTSSPRFSSKYSFDNILKEDSNIIVDDKDRSHSVGILNLKKQDKEKNKTQVVLKDKDRDRDREQDKNKTKADIRNQKNSKKKDNYAVKNEINHISNTMILSKPERFDRLGNNIDNTNTIFNEGYILNSIYHKPDDHQIKVDLNLAEFAKSISTNNNYEIRTLKVKMIENDVNFICVDDEYLRGEQKHDIFIDKLLTNYKDLKKSYSFKYHNDDDTLSVKQNNSNIINFNTKENLPKFPFRNEHIIALTLACQDIVKKQPTVINVTPPVKVFGDIHGQYDDLMRFFQYWKEPNDSCNGDILNTDYIFIGDYVDRGSFSLEVICLLMALKIKFPDKIWLLRGNHEDSLVNETFGFLEECKYRLKVDSLQLKVYETMNLFFEYLPLAAIISDEIICLHGGVGQNLESIDILRDIKRPLTVVHEANSKIEQIVMDVLWSDPTESDDIKGIQPNQSRDGSRYGNIVRYGPDIVQKFLDRNKLKMLIRAHECVMDGFERFCHGRLITIFSATDYCGRFKNAGAMLLINSRLEIIPHIIYPLGSYFNLNWIENEEDLLKRPPTPIKQKKVCK